MASSGSFLLARSQSATISSRRRRAHSCTNPSARFRAAREHDSVRRHRGAAACMVGMEVCYGVIPLVPVHVDHHTVEGADPRHDTTIAKVAAWSFVMPNTCSHRASDRGDAYAPRTTSATLVAGGLDS